MTRDDEAARRRELGRAGEDAAAAFLEGRGLRVLTRNYHTPYGELDIVAADGPCFVFAEVKSGRPGAAVDPRTQFTPRKVKRVFDAALHYLQKEIAEPEPDFRFDFLVVTPGAEGLHVEHYAAVALDDYLPGEEEKDEGENDA